MKIWSEFLNNQGRPIEKWKHYFTVYERHFARFVNSDVTIVEIGCGEGGSLQLWKRYFGPRATIVGLDTDPECAEFEEDQINVRIGDVAEADFLAAVVEEFGPPDIVIDDGSHMMSDVNSAFSALYPSVARDGVYLVEDLHTAYWEAYEGGLGRPDTFIERVKTLIDHLNADSIPEGLPATEFTRSTLSIHFYDSVVVFEKGRHAPPMAVRRGGAEIDEEQDEGARESDEEAKGDQGDDEPA